MDTGRTIAPSAARRLTAEFLRHAQKVPSLPVARALDVAALMAPREQARPGVTWLAVFLRAYALAALEHPALRRAWIPLPWPRLYEHPSTTAAVLVERELDGEPIVLAARIRRPEDTDLATIAAHLRRFKGAPPHEVSEFRQALRLGAMPWPFRRFVFWNTLYLSGATRAKRLGTCMVSSMGQYGARQIHPITPLTTYLSVGPVGADGRVEARIIYDHRVTDDAPIARALRTLEDVLHQRLLPELRALARTAA
jgi:hypothetical protein